MKLTSQFDLGQKVWHIENRRNPVKITCPGCNGTGRVQLLDGTNFSCPKPGCHNGQTWTTPSPQWEVVETLTIGLVRFEERQSPGVPGHEHFDNYKPQEGRQEQYMCVETGIGSGSVYTPDVHIFATQSAAQARCDEVNTTILSE